MRRGWRYRTWRDSANWLAKTVASYVERYESGCRVIGTCPLYRKNRPLKTSAPVPDASSFYLLGWPIIARGIAGDQSGQDSAVWLSKPWILGQAYVLAALIVAVEGVSFVLNGWST
jgi:hypothetical protein